MYKWIFPIHLPHPTLAFIQVTVTPVGGSVPPLIELQARWVTAVFNGKRKLPPKADMINFQKRKQKEFEERANGRFQVRLYLWLCFVFRWAERDGLVESRLHRHCRCVGPPRGPPS